MSNLIVPGVAFAIASSPATYKLTRKIAGPWIANFEGVATPAGLFLHTLFFLLVLFLVGKYLPMVFPRMSMYGNLVEKKFGKGEQAHRSLVDNIGGSPLME